MPFSKRLKFGILFWFLRNQQNMEIPQIIPELPLLSKRHNQKEWISFSPGKSLENWNKKKSFVKCLVYVQVTMIQLLPVILEFNIGIQYFVIVLYYRRRSIFYRRRRSIFYRRRGSIFYRRRSTFYRRRRSIFYRRRSIFYRRRSIFYRRRSFFYRRRSIFYRRRSIFYRRRSLYYRRRYVFG